MTKLSYYILRQVLRTKILRSGLSTENGNILTNGIQYYLC